MLDQKLDRKTAISSLSHSIGPSRIEAVKWLSLITLELTNEEIALICNCPVASVRGWKQGRFNISGPQRRGLWLAWSMIYRPDNLQDFFTVMTWGRFTEAAKRDVGWHRGRYRGKPPPLVGKNRKKVIPQPVVVEKLEK